MFIVLAGYFELKKVLSDDIKGHQCASKYTMSKTIKESDPERYKSICDDLKAGKSLVATQRDNNAGSESVARIKDELMTAGDLKDWKKRTAGKAAALAERMIDKMHNELDNMKASSLPIPAAVLIDKVSALTDQPSQIVSVRHEISQGMAGWLGKNAEQTEQRPANAEIIDINSGLDNRETGPAEPGKRA